MRLAISQQLSLTPPPGTVNAILQVLLTPQSGVTQTVESWSVAAAGIGNAARFSDAFGNTVHLVNQTRPEGEWVVKATGTVKTFDTHGVLGKPGGEPVPAIYKRLTALTKAPASLYARFRHAKENRLDILHGLMERVGELYAVSPLSTQFQSQSQSSGGQSQSQGAGKPPATPADLAHAFIGAARALDIPARYVTGYVLADADFAGGAHVWAEAYDEALGWIGFDCVQQVCPVERHVRLAAGLDAASAQPLRGVPPGDGVKLGPVTVDLVPET